MKPVVVLLALATFAWAAEDVPDALDDSVVVLPESWPAERVDLDDVPLVKQTKRGRRSVYAGTATVVWDDGDRSAAELRWVVRTGKKRRETARIRTPRDSVPRARIELKRVDGVVTKAIAKFRMDDGAGGVANSKMRNTDGMGVAHADPVTLLETQSARVELDSVGRVVSMRLLPDGDELASTTPSPLIELERAGETVTPTSVRRVGNELVARFASDADRVRLIVDEGESHVTLRVDEVLPVDADTLRISVSGRVLQFFDGPLNGPLGEDSVFCMRPLTPNGRTVYTAGGGAIAPGVEWGRRHGIVGGAAALVVTPPETLLEAMEGLEAAAGLPSPHFDGVRARESATVGKSYLFLTYYRPGDIDRVIEYAQLGGFESVLFLRGIWRQSSGTYGINPESFPGGKAEFVQVCDRLHAAGLGVGLHIYGPSISADDPLVTPVPSEGLLAWDGLPLGTAIGIDDTTLELTGAPELPPVSGGGFPGRYVRVGDEIVRYTSTSDGPPFAYIGCERGALGTVAAAHGAGARVRHLATLWDMFLMDPDGPLVDTVTANLGRIVNDADIDMVYFDGTASIPTNQFVDRWYYYNRLLPAHYAAFDHPVLVQTGMGPGRDLTWHVVPRSASADGHGDIKWYLDQRTPSIESIRRGLTVPDVGWYGFDQGRPTDHLEYIAAKCLGWACPMSVQSFRIALESDPRSRETMEMLGRYQRFRRTHDVPEATRSRLLDPAVDFRLLEGDDGTWSLFEAEYEMDRDIRTLPSGAHSWRVAVPETCRIGVEVVRGTAREVNADLVAPGSAYVDTFHDVGPFAPGPTNDFERLVVGRVEKVVGAHGPARKGVDHAFTLVEDARVGGFAAALTASNSGPGIGWCAVGRRFDTPVDLDAMAALGVWIHGDAGGIVLSLELFDDQGRRAVFRTPVHHDGWRLHTFDLATPAAFDRTAIEYLVIVASDLPPGRDVDVRFAALRATPTVVAPVAIDGLTLTIGGRVVTLPAALPPGGSARIDALGRVTLWTGGMIEGTTETLRLGPIDVPAGSLDLRLEVADPIAYPGDVSVRISRMTALPLE